MTMSISGAQFPTIARADHNARIREIISAVAEEKQTRAVVLYGSGGVGKTYFVRGLSKELGEQDVIWLGSYDIDDAEYWLLANLESEIAAQLDKERNFF